MDIVRACTEAEMILSYLQAEFASERFSAQIVSALNSLGLTSELIIIPDLTDDEQNRQRRMVLGAYRGYGQDAHLFERFPQDIVWRLCRFSEDDLACIRYIDYSYWNELSAGTHRPMDAAETIRNGICIYDLSNDDFLLAAEYLRSGGKLPTMVFLTADDETYVIVEGHLRMTAYALCPEALTGVEVIVGRCPKEQLERWM